MNERIKQLVDEATIKTSHKYHTWGDRIATETKEVFDKEKFAELIVRECIAQAVKEEERYDSLGGRDCDYCSAAMANFQGVLAEHFGVKE